jgi:hypothetical protein
MSFVEFIPKNYSWSYYKWDCSHKFFCNHFILIIYEICWFLQVDFVSWDFVESVYDVEELYGGVFRAFEV